MKTFCFYNHKGGVGKTSFTAAVAGQLMINKKKVLMVDSDSQANLSNQFLDSSKLDKEFADYLFADRLSKPDLLPSIIQQTRYKNLFIMPSKKISEGGRLDKWATTEAGADENRNVLKNLLSYLQQIGFDFVLFDMPPSYSELDKRILRASDEVIPILKIEKDSMEGLTDFYMCLDNLRDGDEKPVVKKIIFNMRNKTLGTQNKWMADIETLKTPVFIFPQESAIEIAKNEKNLIQSYKLKPETKLLLEALVQDMLN